MVSVTRLVCLLGLVIPAVFASAGNSNLPHAKLIGRASEDEIIALQIGLKMRNLDQLEPKLRAVSDPSSPSYGEYLDAHDVRDLFYPSANSSAAVKRWLQSEGVEQMSQNGPFINFAVSVRTANRLLNARFARYDVDGDMKIRTREYSIPHEMRAHVDLVHPTTYIGSSKRRATLSPAKLARSSKTNARRQSNGNSTLDCTSSVGPECLRIMYNIDYKPKACKGSRVGFGSFLNQSAHHQDWTLYQTLHGISGPKKFSTALINNGEDIQDIRPDFWNGESAMDSQILNGVSSPLPVTQFITGGSPPFIPDAQVVDNTNEPFLEYYQYLMSRPNDAIPQVISNSYGENEQTVPQEYAIAVCNFIGMMGLRGVTVLESSGDAGVGGGCVSNDGKNRTIFNAMFPASCPYVTAVGGTQSKTEGGSGLDTPVAWSLSSGGFSDYFSQPWYQQDAIDAYLEEQVAADTKEYYKPMVNLGGRGFPDISAHSVNPFYDIFLDNEVSIGGGASASAPVVAGIIGLLNDARLRKGLPTMGFINPWLYSLGEGEGATDITEGAVLGCDGWIHFPPGTDHPIEGAIVVPYASWNATVGWDPASGLGVPNFGDMLDSAMSVFEGCS